MVVHSEQRIRWGAHYVPIPAILSVIYRDATQLNRDTCLLLMLVMGCELKQEVK